MAPERERPALSDSVAPGGQPTVQSQQRQSGPRQINQVQGIGKRNLHQFSLVEERERKEVSIRSLADTRFNKGALRSLGYIHDSVLPAGSVEPVVGILAVVQRIAMGFADPIRRRVPAPYRERLRCNVPRTGEWA